MSALPVVVIACKVFQNFIEAYLPDGLAGEITFLEYGLHAVPRNLKTALQAQIDSVNEPSLVVLGYGLCGNGLHGIKAGVHTLLVPRTDDCIAILLGSYTAYQREFNDEPGTYYLSKGWLESGSNPLVEYRKYVEKYGESQAQWLMDTQYRHYRRLALVAHQPGDLEKYRPLAMEVAEYCAQWGMQYDEILGSDEYLRRLGQTAQALDLAGDDFVVVPPGSELKQNQFIRWK
jgi:Protein of unknown function (DUF1638)